MEGGRDGEREGERTHVEDLSCTYHSVKTYNVDSLPAVVTCSNAMRIVMPEKVYYTFNVNPNLKP